MRRLPYRFAIAFLMTAACQGDELPSGPGTSIAPVEEGPAALQSDTWYGRAKMSTGRAGVTAATVQGVVYVIGGHLTTSDGPATDKVDSYHPNTSTLLAWRNRAPMPEPRGYTNGAAVIGGKIYVSGGYETDEDGNRLRTNSLFRYDPSTNVWSTRASLPRATSGGATVAIDGKLYVYVAYGPDNSSGAALYRYDPSTNKWAERAQPPAIQSGAAAVTLGGKMYVIGGREGKASTVATVSVYNPTTNAWTGNAPLLTRRAGAVARTIDGKIYVAGGATGTSATDIPTEVYDPATSTWSEKAGIPTPRSFAASAGVGGKLYVIGGNDGNGRANEMYVP
jgi:N-acetylneuraminic acid mutarotase